jgi:hypothetical protein
MWHLLLRHVGLLRPYRFERVLAVATALILAIAIFATAVYLAATGALTRHTPRETYFVYLAVLVLAGVLLAPWPRPSSFVLSLALIEYGLGIGSLLLLNMGYANSAILADNYNEDARFRWHPLLQATPISSITVPVVRNTVSHNSAGLRGVEPDVSALAQKSVVAVFGGSATYDIGVSDNEAWANQLELRLGVEKFAVLNHGVPGYSTVEHVIQTVFYENAFGVTPRCALYYVGWNDVRDTHITNLDPGYADYHLPGQIDALKVRRFGSGYTAVSPLATILIRQISAWTDTVRPPPAIVGNPATDPDPVLESFYTRNVRSISAINRDRGIRTIWIGQILNLEELENGPRRNEVNGWILLVRNKDVWPVLSHLNKRLREEAVSLGDVYIDVPVDKFIPSDFYDEGHFLAAGSRKFSALIAPAVAQECK